jgi:hypothetical protein
MNRPTMAGMVRLAALASAMLLAIPARAAFEWEQPSPESWVAGASPFRWPASGAESGFRADAVAARPWSWPDLWASAIRVTGRRHGHAFGLAAAQLGTRSYRETRITAGFTRTAGGQRFLSAAHFLDVRVDLEHALPVHGAELDLGWDAALGPIDVSARALGLVQSRGAVRLRAPRATRLSLRSAARGALLEAAVTQGSRGREITLGFVAETLAPLVLGAGWSTAEPSLRCLAGVRHGALRLTGGLGWHRDLAPSHVIGVAFAPPPRLPPRSPSNPPRLEP